MGNESGVVVVRVCMTTPRAVAALASAACLLAACGRAPDADSAQNANAQEPAVSDSSQTSSSQASTTLTAQLAEYREGFSKRAPQEMQDLFQERVDDLAASGILDEAVNVGDAAPGFTLPNARGEEVSLATLLEQGPVVITWYRGGWCPYCNLTLRAFQERLGEFDAAGATFVAITPETPDNSLSTSEKNELGFQVLSDVGNTVARDYGLVFKLPDDLAAIYNANFDLSAYNGDDSNELPLSATYVIRPDGTVAWAFLSADYRERAEPADVVEAVRGL